MESLLLNKWEGLFIDFLNMTEFILEKRVDEEDNDCYGLVDLQKVNLGDIESDFFYSAGDILDRMWIYEKDYVVRDLEDCAKDINIDLKYDFWEDLLKYRNLMPDNQVDFDLVDMFCNHFEDVDIDKVYNYIVG